MPNAYLKEVGERVRSARMAKHLSQADLSEKLEVTPTYISNLEQGKNKMSILVLVKILETLDISHTAVTDLGPLAVHSGLRHLKMPAAPVKDLRPLLEMPLLESVTLSREMEKAAEELEGRRFEIIYE